MTSSPAPLVFRHCSAWFSTSVPIDVGHEWVNAGGTLASVRKADYLFSDNVLCKDTQSLYLGSKDVVIFRPLYIREVLTAYLHGTKKVPAIGNFILSPEPLLHQGKQETSTAFQDPLVKHKGGCSKLTSKTIINGMNSTSNSNEQILLLHPEKQAAADIQNPEEKVQLQAKIFPSCPVTHTIKQQNTSEEINSASSVACSRRVRVLDIGKFINNDTCGDICHINSIDTTGIEATDFEPSKSRFRVEWLSTCFDGVMK